MEVGRKRKQEVAVAAARFFLPAVDELEGHLYSSLAELQAQIFFPKKVAVMCWQDIRGHAALRVWVVGGRNITETG